MIQKNLVNEISLNFPQFSGWQHHSVFVVLEVKRSKITKTLRKGDCFRLHYRFHFL